MMTDAIIDLTSAVLDDEDWDDATLDDLDRETTWTATQPTTTTSATSAASAVTTPARGTPAATADPSWTAPAPATTTDGPFGAAALTYRAHGWASTIPLPPARKDPPQTGWTGRNTPTPSRSDVQGWLDGPVSVQLRSGERITWDGPSGNIALRLPEGVVGIDVDAYAGKPGAATLAALEALHGPLPDTWTSTSRDWESSRTSSGIRMYRVPPGVELDGVAGPGIEIVQHTHRYLVAAPSVHPEGRIYRWISPFTATPALTSTTRSAPAWFGGSQGTASATATATIGGQTEPGSDLPSVADLPELPAAWVQALRRETVVRGTPMGDREVKAWLLARGPVGQPMCRRMAGAVARVQTAFGDGQARHDATLTASQHVAHLVAAGHTGGWAALSQIGEDFTDATAGEGREGEWAAMLKGAVANAAHEAPEPGQDDPCEVFSFAGAVIDDQEDTWATSAPSASNDDTRAARGTQTTTTSTPNSAGADVTTTQYEHSETTDPTDLSGAVLDDTEETTWTPTPTTTTSVDSASAADTSGARDWNESRSAESPGTDSAPAAVTSPDPDDATDAAQWRALVANREARVLHAAEEERTRRQARRLLDDEEHAATWRVPVTFGTLADELALPEEPVQWRVHDLLPAGGNVLLTAAFKAGKTSLVNALVHSLVDGAPFLGSFAVEQPRRVAVFNYEVGEQQYRRWLRDLDITNTQNVSMLHLRGSRLPITTPRVEDWVVDWLSERQIDVWVVDPFARAFVGCGVSENDNTEVGRFLDTLDVIKHRAGVSELVLPTHTGRAVADEGQERARGATRLDDWADVRWMLNRGRDEDEDTRYLRATGRDVDVEEGALRYDERTRRMTFKNGQGRKGKQSRDIGDAILRAIEEHPGATKTILTREVGAKAENVRVAVERLVRAGMVRVVQGPGRSLMHYRQDVRETSRTDCCEGS